MNGPRSSEDQLIERIARSVPSERGARKGDLLLGIGDDAAILGPTGNQAWVLSCDAFIEGIHFRVKTHPPEAVGYKALARAASDLAAMGATPRLFFLTLALPASRTGPWLDAFLSGMARAARLLKMRLAGGDTTKSATVAASLTVLGRVDPRLAARRSGAHPGDRIYVSGTLGRAQLGLELVLAGHARRQRLAALVKPHLYPRVRTELGVWLARNRVASAMIDLSDSLSTDLTRLAQTSRVGARVMIGQIPAVTVPQSVSMLLPARHLDPVRMALHAGDDYELLFTVPAQREKLLRAAPGFRELTCIGEITRTRHLLLVDTRGKSRPLQPLGWDPFRR